MKITIQAMFLALLLSSARSQTPVDIPLTVGDGVATKTLHFGLNPAATNGIDSLIGESELPPVPPTGVLDARFVGPDTSYHIGQGLSKDYRQGTSTIFGTRVHMLSYQVGDGTTITIGWVLPAGVVGRLQDIVGGTLIDVTMSGTGNYVVNNPSGFSTLKMTIDYNVLRVALKVLLEGPFDTGTNLMNTTLRSTGTLASHFPGIAVPGNAVDSVNVEIRDSLTSAASTIRQFAPAWLLADGSLRSFLDTTQNYLKFDTVARSYHLVIRHRNHLAIMTTSGVALSTGTPSPYDFTTSQSQAYGVNPMKLLGTKYCMYAGDANASGIVTSSDANGVFSALLVSGYDPNDINLSGVVSTADANIIFTNLLVGSQVSSPVRNPGDIVPTADRKSAILPGNPVNKDR